MRLFSMVEEKGKKILIIIIVLTISVVGAYYFIKLRKDSFKVIEKNDKVIKEEKEVKEEKKEEEKEEESISWIVDVKGEVVNPGIHKIEKDMRINDVIKVAGGLTKNADTTLTNLSKKVTDEMVIIIYSKEEVKEILTKEKLSTECGNKEIILNGECTTKKEENASKKININIASKEELMKIPNIGEAKASSIIEYRTKTKFTKIEDIKNVTGIGDSIFELIKDYIEV